MHIFLKENRNWLNLSILSCFGAIAYFPSSFQVSWDLSTYLVYAQNFVIGLGFTDPAHMPVEPRLGYTLMLATLYKLFGPALLPVAIFEMLWSVAFILGLYCLATRLLSLRTAIFITFLFLVSPEMMFWLPRHLDQIWSALLLWSLYVFLTPSSKNIWVGLASGALAAAAFGVKEMAALFWLLPPALFIMKALPAESTWKRLAFFYMPITVSIALIFWAGTLWHAESQVTGMNRLSDMITDIMITQDLAGIGRLAVYVIDGIRLYFFPDKTGVGLFPFIPATPVFIIACGYLAPQFRNDSAARTILLGIAIFSPLMVICAQTSLRISQILFIIALLYLALGRALDIILQKPLCTRHAAKYMIFLFLALALLQGFGGKNKYPKTLAKYNVIVRAALGKPLYEDSLFGGDVATFLKPLLRPDETVLASDIALQHGLYRHLGAEHKVIALPFGQSTPGVTWPYFSLAAKNASYNLITFGEIHKKIRQPAIFTLSSAGLAATLKENNIRYIASTTYGMDATFASWLQQWPGARVIYSGNSSVAKKSKLIVFELANPFPPLPSGLAIDKDVVTYLKYTAEAQPQDFEWYKIHLLKNILNLTDEDIESMIRGESTRDFGLID